MACVLSSKPHVESVLFDSIKKKSPIFEKKCCHWFRITYNFHPVFINCIHFAKIVMALSKSGIFHTNAGHVPTNIRENAAYAYPFHLFSFFYIPLPEATTLDTF